MATVLPSTKSELLAFCQAHVPVWTAAATSIGVSAAECTELNNLTKEAADTAVELNKKRDAAKSATAADNAAHADLRTFAAALVSKIKFKAESTDDPSVYVQAQIPAPLPPSPAPAPAQPTMLRASLESGGGLTIEWKASNPGVGSVVYQVFRKLPMQTMFSLVGFSGGRDKYFTDLTLPAGNSGVQYVVQGARGGISGAQSEILTVMFGVENGGGGGAGASRAGFTYSTTPHDQPVKIAA